MNNESEMQELLSKLLAEQSTLGENLEKIENGLENIDKRIKNVESDASNISKRFNWLYAFAAFIILVPTIIIGYIFIGSIEAKVERTIKREVPPPTTIWTTTKHGLLSENTRIPNKEGMSEDLSFTWPISTYMAPSNVISVDVELEKNIPGIEIIGYMKAPRECVILINPKDSDTVEPLLKDGIPAKVKIKARHSMLNLGSGISPF